MTEAEALAVLQGPDPAAAAKAEAALWQLWSTSDDPEIERLFRSGVEAMERRDLAEAEQIFTRVIERAPGFAEGWNKRATVRYLADDHAGSIRDCEETLARNPHHFGALSGEGLCHIALGQFREAADLFRRALAVHPHLDAVRENLRTVVAEVVKGNGQP